MKNIFYLFKNKRDLVLIFIISIFLSLPNIISICSEYLYFNIFDLQAFLAWNYAVLNHYVPYKDFFYPYGLLNYYKNFNLIYGIIYYLVSPALFTMLFFLLKKIFREKYYLYFSFFSFFIFILVKSGFYTFNRYGVFVILSLFFSYILWNRKIITYLKHIFIGILLGFSVSLVNDQGSYLVISFILLFFINDYINEKKEYLLSMIYLIQTIKKLFFVLSGFLVGFISFLIFLIYNRSFFNFLSYFNKVGEIAIITKTPFFSFINSPANIFTISILLIALIYNLLKILFFKKKLAISTFFQISLIISILILEQKSIIRSIDTQIVFVSLMLFILIVYELINLFKFNKFYKKIFYTLILSLVIISYNFKIDTRTLDISYLLTNVSLSVDNGCFDNNVKFVLSKNGNYTKVINFIKNQKDFNGKIFSYPPGNSIFYILLKQKLQRYYSIFEAQNATAQYNSIGYIKNNNIRYIIMDTDNSLIADGVPDYIRTPIVFKYILNNYYPESLNGKYLILKLRKNSDFFNSELLNRVPNFKEYLLDVYLYKIPYSEGLYKYAYLKNNVRLVSSGNVKKINMFLKSEKVSSKNKVVVLNPYSNSEKNYLIYLKLQSNNSNESKVHFNACPMGKMCIINLSNLPYFYKERVIRNISIDNKFEGELLIYEITNSSILW